MSHKRGFFAEVQHQARVAEQHRQRQSAAQAKQLAAAQRNAEQAQRAAERSRVAAARMNAAEQKQAAAELKRLHEESMRAQADARTLEVADQHAAIDNILKATLDVDDSVDLESLRVKPQHPPFHRPDLEVPLPYPAPIATPEQPVYEAPDRPSGLSRAFGGGKKYDQLTAAAQAQHQQQLLQWQQYVALIPSWHAQHQDEHQKAEAERLSQLSSARAQYDKECQERSDIAAHENERLDLLIAGLTQNDESAIQEYVGIVLGNSVYPEVFPVTHDHDFDIETGELTLAVGVPEPKSLPVYKEFKFNRTKDEIVAMAMTQRELQSRYTGALCGTALRSLHEVFEADRASRINTIALTLQTNAIDPATGRTTDIPLLSVAAERTAFVAFDLSNVDPIATLNLMRATISKNPSSLVPINVAKDVRG